jgi:triphosphatase
MHQSNATPRLGAKETTDATSISAHLRHEVKVLHQRVDRAAAALATSAAPSAVHDTRVAARRLRVLLQAYRREFDAVAAKQFKRALVHLVRDLEAAREADVTRRTIEGLTRNPRTGAGRQSLGLRERAAREYASSVSRLQATVAAAPWQQRLIDLRRLSVLAALVKENRASAMTVMTRLVRRRRRRLRDALRRVGKDPKRLHKIRLKIKALRYLLEDRLSQTAIARSAELRRLAQLQDCLGELHDEENLLEALRAGQIRRDAARLICKGLKARKKKHLREFKSRRHELLQLWRGAVGASGITLHR